MLVYNVGNENITGTSSIGSTGTIYFAKPLLNFVVTPASPITYGATSNWSCYSPSIGYTFNGNDYITSTSPNVIINATLKKFGNSGININNENGLSLIRAAFNYNGANQISCLS